MHYSTTWSTPDSSARRPDKASMPTAQRRERHGVLERGTTSPDLGLDGSTLTGLGAAHSALTQFVLDQR
jgi:hypothetical protein